MNAETVALLNKGWSGGGRKVFLGGSLELQLKCGINPTSTKELKPGSLGWVVDMYMADVPYGTLSWQTPCLEGETRSRWCSTLDLRGAKRVVKG